MSITPSTLPTQSAAFLSASESSFSLNQSPLSLAGSPLHGSASQGQSIVFVDAGVADYQSLIAGFGANAQVYVLDGAIDAVSQITQTLLGKQGITSLQILSHGTNGGLQLGQGWLNADTLPTYVNQLKSWGNALSADADILLYGCNVAQDATGKAFVNLLAQATGADVAASDDLTGNAALGGDWDLEVRTGAIDDRWTQNFAQSGYASVLAVQATRLTGMNSSGNAQQYNPDNLVSLNNELFFTATTSGGGGIGLWTTSIDNNGAPQQPTPIYLDGVGSNATVGNLRSVKNYLYFTVQNGTEISLWRKSAEAPNSNPGSFQPPQRLNGWSPSTPNISNLTQVNDKLFFVSNNQLWSINTAVEENIIGAVPLSPSELIRPVAGASGTTFENLTNIGGTLYFTTIDGGNTTLKRVIPSPTAPSSNFWETQLISLPLGTNTVTNLQMVNNTLYFTANGNSGVELFRIQNGQTSAQMVADLRTGSLSSNPRNLTNINGTLYFTTTSNSQGGSNLWRIGTAGNPEIIFFPGGVGNAAPDNLVNANGILYFTSQDPYGNRTIFRFDPAQGSNSAQQLNFNIQGAFQTSNLVYLDGKVFFTVTTTVNSNTVQRLYQTDRSATYGADAVPFYQSTPSQTITNFQNINGSLYFTTPVWNGNTEVWQVKVPPESFRPIEAIRIGELSGDWTNNGVPVERMLSNWLTTAGKVFFVADKQANQGKEIFSISSQSPNLSLNGNVNYEENATPVLIAQLAYLSDPDSSLVGSQITVRVKNGSGIGENFSILPLDGFNPITLDGQIIKYQNQQIGTYRGGIGRELVISFDKVFSGFNNPDIIVNEVLRRIAYSSTSDRPIAGQREIEILVSDSEGGRTKSSMSVWTNPVNDSPIAGVRRELITGSEDGWVAAGTPGTTVNLGWMVDIRTTDGPNQTVMLNGQAGMSIRTDLLPPRPSGFSPNMTTISLDTESGFLVNFQLEVLNEIRGTNADRNLDGLDDRAGFSLLVVSSDPTKAIELGFFGDRIWAQEDGFGQANSSLSADPSNPTRTLFTQAEGVGFNTRRIVNYTIAVKGSTYTLYADNQVVLNGRLRNYSNATISTGPNPYTVGNTLFFGDNTTAAGANARLGNVSVVGAPIVDETVIDQASSQISFANGAYYDSYNPGVRRIGELFSFDPDSSTYQPYSSLSLENLTYNDPRFRIASPGNMLLGAGLDFEAQTNYSISLGSVPSYYNDPSLSLKVRLRDVDDRPSLVVPTGQTILEDGVLTFNNANGNRILLNDVDQSPYDIEVAITPTGGDIILANSGANVSITNNSFLVLGQILIRGQLAAINEALNGMQYRPWQNTNVSTNPANIQIEMRELAPVTITPPKFIEINVTAINDAPNFISGANQVVTAGTGIKEVIGWATGFAPIANPGEPGRPYDTESGQFILGYEIVSNDRADLFDGAITIDPTGKLTFKVVNTLATGGVATIGLRVRDNGGTTNGGVDTSQVKYFTITVNPSPLSSWVIAAQADFDRDGRADILWRNEQTGWNVIWKMGANGVESTLGIREIGDTNWQVAGTGDFNGDGMTDILWRHKTTGWINYWQMNDMAWQQSVVLPSVVDPNFQIAAIADFDNDGKSDILWRNKTQGWNNIWKMGAGGWQQSIVLNTVGAEWQVAGVGDFNQDGKVDIMWRNTVQGWNVIWKMNGFALQEAVGIDAIGDTNFEVAGIGDFDGDGKVDILWRNKATGWVNIWKMNGTTKQSTIVLPTIVDPDFQISGIKDTNGDGKLDIVLRNKRTGWNVLWKMNNGVVEESIALTAVR